MLLWFLVFCCGYSGVNALMVLGVLLWLFWCECSYGSWCSVVIVYSFIHDISKAPLQVHYYSEDLPTQHGYCVGVGTPKRYRQLRVKDLPKVPTWWLEWDSNLRPSGRKALNLPLSNHTPKLCSHCIPYIVFPSHKTQ